MDKKPDDKEKDYDYELIECANCKKVLNALNLYIIAEGLAILCEECYEQRDKELN